ncbi:MAG: LytTR family transcriptional regulator [Dysgonamonadaceae bacterium]|nr:LytTR family transcriptional regulator [Dysgonamonadaceae bacterium]
MNNPFLQSVSSRLLYISIWIMLAVIQILLMVYTGPKAEFTCTFFYDSLIFNTLQAIVILALWYPAKYYPDMGNILLFLLFHLFLLLIAFTVWTGAGYLVTNVMLSGDSYYTEFFLATLPLRIFYGLLIYIIFVLVYNLYISASKLKVQRDTIENAKAEQTSLPKEKLTRISVKKRQEIHVIPVGQIFYIEANGDYVLIHTAESKYLKGGTMKYWEEHLPDAIFVRTHRSFIINIELIAKIELYEKEIYKVRMKNGSSLRISNSGYKLLKQKMQL